MIPKSCPSLDKLRGYVLGDTAEDVAQQIEDHLTRCPACEETLAQFDSADDTLVRDLPLAASARQDPEEGWLARLREEVPHAADEVDNATVDRPLETAAIAGEFLGSYRLLARIGRGGMGVVYRALHTQLDRVTAVKVLSPHLVASATARARFDREIQVVGRLDHPGIVRAADAGRVGQSAYLVMEYVDGVDLARAVRRGGPLPVSEACEAARQVAEALAAAHRGGAVHRDVKPSNLMADRSGQVKLLDFGLARLSAEAAATHDMTQGRLLGTLAYMAPEQAGSGDTIDHRTDLYGLGATLFFLLTGQSPHEACEDRPLLEQLRQIAELDPPRVSQLRSDVPAELDELVARLLARRPQDRPESGEEVAASLASLAGGDLARRVAELAPPAADPRRANAEEVAQAEASLAELLGKQAEKDESGGSTPVKPQSEKTGFTARRLPILPLAAVAVLLAACLGVVLLLPTPKGTLRIESDADYVRLELINDQGEVQPLEIRQGEKETLLRVGRYRVRLAGGHDRLEVKPGEITLIAGRTTVARIRYETAEPGAPQSKKPLLGQPFPWPPDAPPPATAPFDAQQAKRHQRAWAEHLGLQVETTNSVGAKMVLIPPGEFLMGSSDEQVAAAVQAAEQWGAQESVLDDTRNAEQPQHRVVITKPFLISATEVTAGQYRKFTEAAQYVVEGRDQDAAPDDLPRIWITWKDAAEYCKWLGTQEGTTYRLPTEAEWEYACRAGTTTQFSFGDTHTKLEQYSWSLGGGLRPAGKKLPNAFGLHDMHGSLYEWCGDYWGERWYEKSPGIDPSGPAAGSERVVRGGAFHSGAPTARSAFRNHIPPRKAFGVLGFRCVRVLDTPKATASASAPAREDEDPTRPRTAPLGADRRAARWVLSIGGTVRVNDDDRDIRQASKLPTADFQLTQVNLDGNPQVTDAGLACFEGCMNVRALRLGNTNVSDTGLAHFRDCKNLRWLSLPGTRVSDVGLALFRDCKDLANVTLGGTQVSDAGLVHLKGCEKSLTYLGVTATQVSDAGLAHIRDCENLITLGLWGTRVSDAGLAHLAGMAQLKSLDLGDTQVTPRGVAELHKKIPLCRIHSHGGVIEPQGRIP